MKIKEAQQRIKEAGGKWKVFEKWMVGQTMGLNKDGSVDIYDDDVERFIRMNCNPKNENSAEFD